MQPTMLHDVTEWPHGSGEGGRSCCVSYTAALASKLDRPIDCVCERVRPGEKGDPRPDTVCACEAE